MKKLYILLLLLPLLAVAQNPGRNYVKTKTYKAAYTGTQTLTANDTLASVSYYDGLGRPVQTVAAKAGGQGQDIVTPIVYDALGRESQKYLPYINAQQTTSSLNYRTSDLTAGIKDYYNAKYPGELNASNKNPYSETVYEASPLGRPLKQGAPGQDWMVNSQGSDHTIKFDYQTNKTKEVRKFKVDFSGTTTEGHTLGTTGYYAANTLFKTITKDENWVTADGKDHTSEEFKDKEGRVVLKRGYNNGLAHDTYYVYDKFSNLSYVIPPLAADAIVIETSTTVNWALNFPWTALSLVDAKLAADYQKELIAYNNSDILNIDLLDKYGGQGGFSVSTDTNGNVVLGINITTAAKMQYRNGVIADLAGLGQFANKELGRLAGADYEYIFTIEGNKVLVKAIRQGKVPSMNVTFNGGQKLDYSQNYPWTALCKGDEQIIADYEIALKQYTNAEILTTYINNPYGATGGISVSVNEEDTVTVQFNISTVTPLSLNTGAVFPLNAERRIKDCILGSLKYGDYDYTLSIKDNSLYIEGQGLFTHFSPSFSKASLTSYAIAANVAQGLCYEYHYDYHNRVIEKKIPDNGWTHIVYDKLDRPVLTQDQNQRANGKWLFTKYDSLGRVAYTGEYTDAKNRKTIQDSIAGLSLPLYEDRAGSFVSDGITVKYGNAAFPTASISIFAVNFYDDYTFLTGDESGLPVPVNSYEPLSQSLMGLATGSKVRVIGSSNTWITTALGYDAKGRNVYFRTYNKYLRSQQIIIKRLDFSGQLTEQRTQHIKSEKATITIYDYYAYDLAGRMLKHTQMINNVTELIVWNKYDELGQLVQKKVGGTPGTTYENTPGLQTVDYAYNIRGWLRKINDPDTNLTNDLFAFKVNYNTGDDLNSKPLYNGNIAETHWRSKTDNKDRYYSYSYDALNRLKVANYMPVDRDYSGFYTEGPVTYDKAGNIMSLTRYSGASNGTAISLIDQLTYSYFPLSNQLRGVNDNATTEGFNNGDTGANDDYEYDAAGNMVKDLNKGIGTVTAYKTTYNHLNLPTRVRFNAAQYIDYFYDATGVKQIKRITENNIATLTQYDSGFIYEKTDAGGTNLQSFFTEEGYVVPAIVTAADGTQTYSNFTYIYQYKDHLGNVRLSYTKDSNGALQVIEENSYYAFGLKHKGYNDVVSSLGNAYAQKYKYNGKELEKELGKETYAYGWRDYDPAISRFNKIDRFSEKYHKFTAYGYAGNNPVLINDIQGDSLWISFGRNNQRVLYENGNLLNKDGSRYEGNGVKVQKDGSIKITDSFLKIVVSALTKIYTAEKESGTDMISTLQSSNYNFNIEESSSTMFDPRGPERIATRINDASYYQGINLKKGQIGGSLPSNVIGSGGTIYWNPDISTEIQTNKGIKNADPILALAHEMFHGFDANSGNLVWSQYGGTDIKEIRAVYFSNQLGNTKTFNTGYYQTQYSVKSSGYNLLDSSGQPRTVSPTILWDK